VSRGNERSELGRWLRWTAILLAILFLLSYCANKEGDDVVADCGVPTVSTPLRLKGITVSQRIGKTIHKLDDGDMPSGFEMARSAWEIRNTIMIWWKAMHDSANNDQEHSFVTGYKLRIKEAQQAALDACCPQPDVKNEDPKSPPDNDEQPWNPKNASLQKNTKLSGKYLAADALKRAGFPDKEIPTFVSIAKYESGFGADTSNPRNTFVKGWWQTDIRYWGFGDANNVYDNAVSAKKARDDAVKNHRSPYDPWSTKKVAQRNAAQYQTVAASLSTDTPPPAPEKKREDPTVEANPELPTVDGHIQNPETPQVPSGCASTGGESGGNGSGAADSLSLNSVKVIWPVPGHRTGTYAGHDGVDINRGNCNDDLGDKIVAPTSGKVSYVGWDKGYGNAIFIKTDIGNYTMIFGHTSAQSVQAGDRVSAGQKIGEVGNTYKKAKICAHLHFSIKPGMTYQTSLDFLNGKAKGFEVRGVASSAQIKGNIPAAISHSGYTPRALQVRSVTRANWGCATNRPPCINKMYGYVKKNIAGTNTPSDHSTGNAVDIMTSNKKLGNEIAEYMKVNSQALNVKYIIWNHQIWSTQRKREGWRSYNGVNPHTDHVHVSVESGTAA
jgi:murein DD-endopeptidase MepM/ murein hydrolase activator NlpD